MRRALVALAAASVALRLTLHELGIVPNPNSHPELHTGFSSPATCQEQVYTYINVVVTADMRSFRSSPAICAAWSWLAAVHAVAPMVALSMFDFAAAAAALALASHAWRHERPFVWEPGRDAKPGMVVFASFAFSPALVAGALGDSLATVPLSLAVCALAAATQGRVLGTGLLLGFAAHAQPVLASLLAPVVCIAAHALDMPRTRGYRAMGRHQGGFRAVATASLFAAVGAVAGFLLPLLAAGSIQDAARYVEHGIAGRIAMDDVRPNVGPAWYLLAQTFPQFRPLSWHALAVVPLLLPLPLAIRFRHAPVTAAVSSLALVVLLDPYATLHGAAMATPLLLATQPPLTREALCWICAAVVYAMHASLPVAWWLWVAVGTGNANFFYFQTLALQLAGMLLALDSASALLRCERALQKQVA